MFACYLEQISAKRDLLQRTREQHWERQDVNKSFLNTLQLDLATSQGSLSRCCHQCCALGGVETSKGGVTSLWGEKSEGVDIV